MEVTMLVERVDFSASETAAPAPVVARVNGVALCNANEAGSIAPEALRQRACTELLRQAAQRAGLLDAADAAPADGVISEAASQAIEAWLEQQIDLPEPSDEACRRYYAAHAARFSSGERAQLRHILFAVTPGTDVVALRNRAEACLLDVRCHDGAAGSGFAEAARTLSNCPSGADGGALGWLMPEDCAPEFAREIFHGDVREVGVLPRLVHSRFGLHVVEVQAREGGTPQAFESVRGAVVMALRQQTYVTAMRQLLQVLAGEAVIEGVDLDAADSPLVQ
ncbi:MAG: peptidylprolyl isomerase [Piscinibacter sp.]|nr:peptidylprolyl isomerase [Piscinibacter sp.]